MPGSHQHFCSFGSPGISMHTSIKNIYSSFAQKETSANRYLAGEASQDPETAMDPQAQPLLVPESSAEENEVPTPGGGAVGSGGAEILILSDNTDQPPDAIERIEDFEPGKPVLDDVDGPEPETQPEPEMQADKVQRTVAATDDVPQQRPPSSVEKSEEVRRINNLKQQLRGRIAKDMGKGPDEVLLVGVIGSAECFNEVWTEDLCKAIGRKLAREAGDNVAIVTGGMHGVGELCARAFADERKEMKQNENTYMVLPPSDPNMQKYEKKAPVETVDGELRFKEWDFGTTVFLGDSIEEREKLMAEIPVVIMLEGGPAAHKEATLAIEGNRSVIPIAVTGGAAGNMLPEEKAPRIDFELPEVVLQKEGCREAWNVVTNKSQSVEDKKDRVEKISDSASKLVKALYTHTVLIQGQALKAEISKDMGKDPGDIMLVGIIGSTEFKNTDWTQKICQALGQELALAAGDAIAIMTGGMYGVGEHVARSFAETRKANGNTENTYMVLPKNESRMKKYKNKAPTEQDADGNWIFREWDFGKTIFIGESVGDRENVLAAVTPVLIMLEGGPGAKKEATMALKNGHWVITIPITGGGARDLKGDAQNSMQKFIRSLSPAEEQKKAEKHYETVTKEDYPHPDTKTITDIALATSALVTTMYSSLLAKTQKKPVAIISYHALQAEFKQKIESILEASGFECCSSQASEVGSSIDVERSTIRSGWLDVGKSKTSLIVFILSKEYVQSPAYKNEFQFIMQDRMASIALPVRYGKIENPPPSLEFFLSQVNSVKVKNTGQFSSVNGIPPTDMVGNQRGSWELIFKLISMLTAERVLSFSSEAELMEQHRSVTANPSGSGSAMDANHQQLESLLKEHLLLEISKDMEQSREEILLVGISGSVDFHNTTWSKEICEEIGRELALVAGENVAIVTGGFKGVGEHIARAFAETRIKNKQKPHTYMVLPWGETDEDFKENANGFVELSNGKWKFKEWDFGKTIFVGETVKQRERVLGICQVVIVVEGGPGSRTEATQAIEGGRHVIPIAVTGGAAGDGTVPFRFPEQVAKNSQGEYGKLKEAWDVVMDKRGTNGEGLKTKSQRSGKKLRIEKIARSASFLVSTILKYNINNSSQSLFRNKESYGSSSVKSGQGMVCHRPKNLANICRRKLRTSSTRNSTISNTVTDNERRLMEYLDELAETYKIEGSEPVPVPVYFLNGHRGNTKFADNAWEKEVDEIADELDQRHGEHVEYGGDGKPLGKFQSWICMYSGDPYIEGQEDVAHVAARLRARGVRVLALLPDINKEDVLEPQNPVAYDHLKEGGVYFYPSEYFQGLNSDTDGKTSSTTDRRILTGGRHPQNGRLCGASKLYFDLLEQHIQGHILVGGGDVSRDDYRECVNKGIPVCYVEAEVAVKPFALSSFTWHSAFRIPDNEGLDFQELYGKFGVIDSCHKFYQNMLSSNPVMRTKAAKSASISGGNISVPTEDAPPSSVESVEAGQAAASMRDAKVSSLTKRHASMVKGIKSTKKSQVHPAPPETVTHREAWTPAPTSPAKQNDIAERFVSMHQQPPDKDALVQFRKPQGISSPDKLLVEGSVKFMAQGTHQCSDDEQKKLLTTVSTKGVLQVWNLQSGDEDSQSRLDLLLMLPVDEKPRITAVQIFERSIEELVVVGCDDGNAYLWRMDQLKEAEQARNETEQEDKRKQWKNVGEPVKFCHWKEQEGTNPPPIETLAAQGDRLVTGDSTKRICIWDMSEPQETPLASFTALTTVQCLYLSRGKRENNFLFTGCEDGSLHVYDIMALRSRGFWASENTSDQSQPQKAHAGALSAICGSNDGELLITGGSDKMVRVWSLETCKMLRAIRLPDERSDKPGLKLPVAVNALCILPHDSRLAVGFTIGRGVQARGTVFVYDLGAISCKQVIAIELTAGRHVNFGMVNLLYPSLDGKTLFSHHRRVMASRNVNSFDRIWKWDIDPCYDAMSLEQSSVALERKAGVQLVSVAGEAGTALEREGGDQLPNALEREGGDQLPNALEREGGDQLPNALEREGGDQLPNALEREGGDQLPNGFVAVCTRSDGKVVASQGCKLHVLDVEGRRSFVSSNDTSVQDHITCISLHEGQQRESGPVWLLFTASKGGKISVWDSCSDGRIHWLGTRSLQMHQISHLAVDPLGDRLYYLSNKDSESTSVIEMWNLPAVSTGESLDERWKQACQAELKSREAGDFQTLVQTNDGMTVRQSSSNDKLDATPSAAMNDGNSVCCLCACPVAGQRMVVSGSQDGKILMQCEEKTSIWWDVALEGHTQRVNSIDFCSDGMRIVSGSDDRTIRIWDAQARTQITTIDVQAGMGTIWSVRFGNDGDWVVSGSESPDWNGPTCSVWDVSTGSLVAGFDAEPELCSSVALIPGNNRQVVAACEVNCAVCVYDIDGQPDLTKSEDLTAAENKESAESLKLVSGQTRTKWDLSFTLFAPAKSQWQGGEESAVPSTLQVTKGKFSTNFFLPLASGKHKLELREKQRHGFGIDVLVAVYKDGVDKGECLYQSWLLDLPRGQRFRMLQSAFDLPPLYCNSPVVFSNGRAGHKSFVHHLASASNSERMKLLKKCEQQSPMLASQGIAGLLGSTPGLLWVKDSDGKIPLELFLEHKNPDSRFFTDLMNGYKDAARHCKSQCDLKALKRIMSRCANLMRKMDEHKLNMDCLWEIFDNYGAVVLDIECLEIKNGTPFSKAVFYAHPKNVRAEHGNFIIEYLRQVLARVAQGEKERANKPSKLMVVTLPGLFDSFDEPNLPSEAGSSKWEFIVDKVPPERFSMPMIRAAVDFRQNKGGLKLVSWLLFWHCLVLACCCALLYLHKWKLSRLPESDMSMTNAEIGLSTFLCVMAMVLIFQESRQFYRDFWRNFSDPWTYVDMFLGFCLYGITSALATAAPWFPCYLAFALVLGWFKLIGYMRSQKATASIVRMIMQVASKTKIYFLVLGLLVIGFSMANHTLLPSFIYGSGLGEWHVMLIRQIRLMLADFGIFEYEVDDDNVPEYLINTASMSGGMLLEDSISVFQGSYINYTALLITNLAFIYLVSIILLNLLISVISEIYEQVKEDELVALTTYRAKLDMELDQLWIEPYKSIFDQSPIWLQRFLTALKLQPSSHSHKGQKNDVQDSASPVQHLLFKTVQEDEAETSWVPSTEGQSEGLRPLFRRIKDVKDSISSKLDGDVVLLKNEVDSVRGGLAHMKDDMEAIVKAIVSGAQNSGGRKLLSEALSDLELHQETGQQAPHETPHINDNREPISRSCRASTTDA